MAKNYAIGRFVSLWWNEGTDGKRGYYTVNIRRTYKDKTGSDVEEKISMFASDAIQLSVELDAVVKKILTLPREIVKKETTPEPSMQPLDVSGIDDTVPF